MCSLLLGSSLIRSQSVSARTPSVSSSSRAIAVVVAAAAAVVVGSSSIVAKATPSLPGLLRWRGRPVLVKTKVIDQKRWRHQKVFSVHHRDHVHGKVIQVAECNSVEHWLVGVSAHHRDCQIRKGQVQALDGKSPDVGLVGWVLFGPNVEDVIRHGGIEEGRREYIHHQQEWVGDQTSDRSQEPAKGVIGRPASRPRVEGNTLLVLLAETALHVHQEDQTERKRTTVAKTSQKAIDF